jgi:hypothetical protein
LVDGLQRAELPDFAAAKLVDVRCGLDEQCASLVDADALALLDCLVDSGPRIRSIDTGCAVRRAVAATGRAIVGRRRASEQAVQSATGIAPPVHWRLGSASTRATRSDLRNFPVLSPRSDQRPQPSDPAGRRLTRPTRRLTDEAWTLSVRTAHGMCLLGSFFHSLLRIGRQCVEPFY